MKSLALRVADDRASEWMIRVVIQRSGQLQHVALTSGEKAFDGSDAELACGQRPRLVHGYHADFTELLHRGSSAEEDTSPCATRDSREDGGWNGENQRTRRGDDQQRHR